jgi:hypothetical protein
MRPTDENDEKIVLRRGTFLVLWSLLNRTLRDPKARTELRPEKYQILFNVDEAELSALHWLTGAIQRGVLEVMSTELPRLVEEEKRWIMSRPK